jgi:hypothetical protein
MFLMLDWIVDIDAEVCEDNLTSCSRCWMWPLIKLSLLLSFLCHSAPLRIFLSVKSLTASVNSVHVAYLAFNPLFMLVGSLSCTLQMSESVFVMPASVASC